MRQLFYRTDHSHPHCSRFPNRRLNWFTGGAIGAAMSLLSLACLPAQSLPIQDLPVPPPPTVETFPSSLGQAEDLTGTVSQPYVDRLLPVPQVPTGREPTDPTRSGGPVESLPTEPLMEIEGGFNVTIEPIDPIIDPLTNPTGRSALEQTNIFRVTLP